MLHNNRSRRPEPEAPSPPAVQDYLARKYASLGIDPPEPNGHQPGHIPANLNDERTDAAPTPSEAEQRSDPANKPCDERSNVANLPPDPAPTASPESAPQNPHPASGANTTAPKPLTRDQRTALDLLDRGQSVTEIMDTLGRSRQTFYDWGKANPAFAHGAESARDNRRGVLADGVHDLQLAALSLVGNYIRSDNSPDSIRLRAASLVFRHAHSETLLPRRILATFTAPDGISPASPTPHNLAPADPDPLDPPHEDPGGPGTDATPKESDQHSDAASTPSEQHSDLADTTPQPAAVQENADCVRSVRFENSQSKISAAEPAPSEIRTPNISDGFTPNPEHERRVPAESPVPPAPSPTAEGAITDVSASSDERSDVASTPGEQRSDLANSSTDPGPRIPDPDSAPPAPPQKPRKPETILADAYLSATFLHKHEPRAAFETLLKHHREAYAPATPQEELLTFRITQKSWILRRLDTFERVIADSAVTKVREKHPNAAPAACIAMTFLTRNDTEETSFYNRIAQQRKDHEAALDRLESKLQTLQARREFRQDQHDNREARREDRRASAAPTRQTPIPATALPFRPAPALRATG